MEDGSDVLADPLIDCLFGCLVMCQGLASDESARKMLKALYDHGFLPFHAHFSGLQKEYGCCWMEYSFLNTRAPRDKWPARRNENETHPAPRAEQAQPPSWPSRWRIRVPRQAVRFFTQIRRVASRRIRRRA